MKKGGTRTNHATRGCPCRRSPAHTGAPVAGLPLAAAESRRWSDGDEDSAVFDRDWQYGTLLFHFLIHTHGIHCIYKKFCSK